MSGARLLSPWCHPECHGARAGAEWGWRGRKDPKFIFGLGNFKAESSRLSSPIFMVTQLLLFLFATARRSLCAYCQALFAMLGLVFYLVSWKKFSESLVADLANRVAWEG